MGIIVDVPEAGLDYVLYGDKSNILSSYLYNQMQSLPKNYNSLSERIYNNLATSYNYVTNKLIQSSIINELRNSGMNIVDDYFRPIESFVELQNANLTMQRWIMANPYIKDMYIKQNIDGYSDSYVDLTGTKGTEDYNYRRVMDGVVVPTDSGFNVTHYYEELLSGDRDLTSREKFDILSTWDAMDWFLKNCEFDFTCKSKTPVKYNKE